MNENNPILDVVTIREGLKQTTAESLSAIMGKEIKNEMKRIIKEDDSDYEEEEVGLAKPDDEMPEVEDEEGVDVVDDEDVIIDDDMPEEEDEKELGDMGDYEVDDETWDVSQDDETAIKVFKSMRDSDQVVITKQGDGSVELSDEETGADYIIDLNEEDEVDDTLGESNNMSLKPFKPTKEDLNASLGPKKSKLPAPVGISDTKKGGFGAGTGGRRGTGKVGDGNPFDGNVNGKSEFGTSGGGKKKNGNSLPFNNKVNENDEMEDIEIDENLTRTHRSLRNVGKKSKNQIKVPVEQERVPAVRDGAQLKTEEIQRLKKMVEENIYLKETVAHLREAATDFYLAAQATYLTNQRLGKVVQLVFEHSTTSEEKYNIIDRFEGCNTQEDVQKLYETIGKELKSRKPLIENIVDNSFNNIVTEIKLTEQPAIVNEEVQKMLSLMHRMDKI